MDTTNTPTLTSPRRIWFHETLTAAKVSVEDAQPFREMLNRWYVAGEPANMAAHSLTIAVKERRNAIRREQAAKDDGLSVIARARQESARAKI